MTKTMTVPKSVFGLYRQRDEHSARYALDAVRLEPADSHTTVAMATDGCQLTALYWPEPLADERLSIMVPGDTAQRLHRDTSKTQPATLSSVDGNGTWNAAVPKKQGDLSIQFHEKEGRYPRWRDHIPDDNPDAIKVTLDANLLADMLRTISGHVVNDEGHAAFTLEVTGPEEPVKLTAHGPDGHAAVAVIMPIKPTTRK